MVFARAIVLDPERVESLLRGAAGRLASLGIYLLGTGLALTWWGNAASPLLLVAGGVGLLYPILAGVSPRNLLCRLGVHSLSIFLVHVPFFALLVPKMPESVTAGVTACMVGAVVVAILAPLALEWAMEITPRLLDGARRRWGMGAALRAGLLLAAGYAALIPLELAVRRAEPVAVFGWGERPALQPDDRFGWRAHPRPDRTRLRWGGCDYEVAANSLASRARNTSRARTPGSVSRHGHRRRLRRRGGSGHR